MIIAEVISFSHILGKVNPNMVPFEGVAANTNMEITFAIAFLLCLTAVCFTVIRFYYGSKSIHTIYQVQPGINTLYYSLFISGVFVLLLLWLTQTASIYICYGLYSGKCTRESYMLANGLFKGVVDYGFFRMFFPISLFEWLKLAFIILSSVSAAIFTAVVILIGRYEKLWAVGLWGIVLIDYYTSFGREQNNNFMWYFVALVIACSTLIWFYRLGSRTFSDKSIL